MKNCTTTQKTTVTLGLLMIGCFAVYALSGCTKFKIPVSGGKYITYEKGWIEASAERVDFYYEDPNVTVWLVVNDPNSSVNAGRLSIKEPKSGVELGMEAK